MGQNPCQIARLWYNSNANHAWGRGSVGRAMRSQRIGQGFESPRLHHHSRKAVYATLCIFCRVFAFLPASVLRVAKIVPFTSRRFLQAKLSLVLSFSLPVLFCVRAHALHSFQHSKCNSVRFFVCLREFAGDCPPALCAANPFHARADADLCPA